MSNDEQKQAILPKSPKIGKRKNYSVSLVKVNSLKKFKGVRNFDLSKIRDVLKETEEGIIFEGKLLKKFMKNRALRKKRGMFKSLIKIVQFWMDNKIKRGEGLKLLEKELSFFEPVRPVDYQIIPELKPAMSMRNSLRILKDSFSKDDYYLTLVEQYEKQYEDYNRIFSEPLSPLYKQYWKDMNSMKGITEQNALHRGSNMCHFELPNEYGRIISSKELLKKGPIVLSFFVGSFCPYCVNEMCVLADNIPRFTSLGASLISIGIDVSAIKYFRKLGVVGDIVIDNTMKVSKRYKLVYKMTKSMIEYYDKCGCVIPKWNDGNGWYVPIPATYIIDTDGKIVFDYVQIEYYKRLEPEIIIEVLTNLLDRKMGLNGNKNENGEYSLLSKRKKRLIDDDLLQKMKIRKIVKFDHKKLKLVVAEEVINE